MSAPGDRKPLIQIINLTTGATVQRIFAYAKPIFKGTIQNISTEDVTLYTKEGQAAGTGIILNAATLSGKGGGALDVGNIDLFNLFFVRTTSGDTLAVYSEV